MRRLTMIQVAFILGLSACAPVDQNAPTPKLETGIDPDAWVTIPAGPFLEGQFNHEASIDYNYEMMVTDVTVAQYASYLNEALSMSVAKIEGERVVGYYPGNTFHGVKHEVEIAAGNYIFIPLKDPAMRLNFDGQTFTIKRGFENHPMTTVSWFGAKAYCDFYDWRLPTEREWEKAARGTDDRPYPWGDEIQRNNANFYSSRDPFENKDSFGSRTTPVGFYNGQTYNGYTTLNSASPYKLYDMAGNVWQWTGDIYEGQHYRYLRGGSKDTYDMDLRIWVRNNATPTYYSPAVGFRCAR